MKQNSNATRKSEWIRNKNDRLNIIRDVKIPDNFDGALKTLHNDKWKEAIYDEIGSHSKNETGEVVKRPNDKIILDSRWIFQVKKNLDGSVNKFKARFVTRGFNQIYGKDYSDIFSPVMRLNNLRIILTISVENFDQLQYDVTTAHLNDVLKNGSLWKYQVE